MEMLDAIYAGDEEEVAKLLDEDPMLLEEKGYAGNPSLVVAARYGKLGVMRLLAQRGARVNARGADAKTALHWAAEGGYEAVVAFLISKGVRMRMCDDYGKTPLVLACEGGHLGVVQKLVQHTGWVIHPGEVAATTALRWAARKGHKEMVKYSLSKGAQANLRDSLGRTALIEACSYGHLGVVEMLIQHMGGQALEDADEEGHTALSRAALWGYDELVAFLLSSGAQAKSRDVEGVTILMGASMWGHLGVVQMLVQHMGAEGLEDKDRKGYTALSHAARWCQEEVAEFLLSKGAQASSRDLRGRTNLIRASQHGHLSVVQLLVQQTGGFNERDVSFGRTALHWAAITGHEEMVRLLLVAGANPSIRDNQGKTPRETGARINWLAFAAAFDQWWEGELERRYVLCRAVCLHKDYTTQRDKPSSQVPKYLDARVAGQALPSVEVGAPMSQERQQEEQEAGARGQRKAVSESVHQQESVAGGNEMHAVLQYVLKALNAELFTELLEGFHLFKNKTDTADDGQDKGSSIRNDDEFL